MPADTAIERLQALKAKHGANWADEIEPNEFLDAGAEIEVKQQRILDEANLGSIDPWWTHCLYEELHPFLDGNGRSGRVLWLWQQRGRPTPPLLFLHRFYYESLDDFDGRRRAGEAT